LAEIINEKLSILEPLKKLLETPDRKIIE